MRRPSERHALFARLYFLQAIWEPLGFARHRRAVARGVAAPALEVGVGTGMSLPYYPEPPLVACDLNVRMVSRARRRARRLGYRTAFVVARAEALPFRTGIFSTVVTEAVLCSVDSVDDAASEIRRVLGAEGHYRFVEHEIATWRALARLQRVLAPVWRRIFAGCRIDRHLVRSLEAAGLQLERIRRCSGGAVVRATFSPVAHRHERHDRQRDAGWVPSK